MDGAQACYPYSTFIATRIKSRRAWRFCKEALNVNSSETASSADLGGSSKYSNENFED